MSHPLLQRLASRDPEERARACRAATEDPAAVLFLDALAERLADPAPQVARSAGEAIAALAIRHDVKPTLTAALTRGDANGRLEAALALARIEPPSLRLLPALAEGLALPDGRRRWQATRSLVACGRLHGEVLPLLLGLARGDARGNVRCMARHALRELAPDAPEVASALLEGTRDPDLAARRAAYAGLAALVDPPREVIDGFAAALGQEPDAASRQLCEPALERLRADV